MELLQPSEDGSISFYLPEKGENITVSENSRVNRSMTQLDAVLLCESSWLSLPGLQYGGKLPACTPSWYGSPSWEINEVLRGGTC